MYSNVNEFYLDQVVEETITREEQERANALEAILIYDSIVKARESKEDIRKQIEHLNKRRPIAFDSDNLAVVDSVEDLQSLFDSLNDLENSKKPRTKTDLRNIFTKLMDIYTDDGNEDFTEYALPIARADIKEVFNQIKKDDGTDMEFN